MSRNVMNAQRDRVFTTLNILNDILEYTGETKLSAYACARTCSKWKEPALDVLWGHMDSFMPLLCLLGQLAIQPTSPKNDKHEYVFISTPTYANWERFNDKARRVRTLQYYDHNSKDEALPFIGPRIFQMLAARTTLALLPTLKSLAWVAREPEYSSHICAFLYPGVEAISLVFARPFSTFPMVAPFLEHIQYRTPMLHHLFISASFSGIGPTLENCVSRLTYLTTLQIPRCWQTPSFLSVVVRLPHLMHLLVTEESQCYHNDYASDAALSMEDATSYLQVAVLGCRVTSVLALQSLGMESSMKRLDMWVPPKIFPKVVEALALACPFLQSIRLRSAFGKSNHKQTFKHLYPLLRCKELRSMELHTDWNVSLDDEDVEAMADNWPKLEVLILSPGPNKAVAPVASLSIISTLSSRLPALQELGFYFDFNSIDLEAARTARFPSLETLVTGTSFPSSSQHTMDIAMFLELVCPKLHTIHPWACTSFPLADDTAKWMAMIPLWESVSQARSALLFFRECVQDKPTQMVAVKTEGSQSDPGFRVKRENISIKVEF